MLSCVESGREDTRERSTRTASDGGGTSDAAPRLDGAKMEQLSLWMRSTHLRARAVVTLIPLG